MCRISNRNNGMKDDKSIVKILNKNGRKRRDKKSEDENKRKESLGKG